MKLTCFCEKTARNDTRFFSLNRQRLWAFAALLALMPVILAACGGGGASSAEQAAQNLAKAFANNDTEAAFRMCQPSFRETLSAAEKERWIDRGGLRKATRGIVRFLGTCRGIRTSASADWADSPGNAG